MPFNAVSDFLADFDEFKEGVPKNKLQSVKRKEEFKEGVEIAQVSFPFTVSNQIINLQSC